VACWYSCEMDPDAYRHEILERLLNAVVTRARAGDIEVTSGDGTEITARRLSPPIATFTAELLPSEPSFSVNFNPGFSHVTFAVSEADYDRLDVKTTRHFASVDEAAGWLVDSLRAIG